MIIVNNGKKVVDVPTRDTREVWVNGYMVWPEKLDDDIISCFARGYWIDEYPWTDSLGWKNNI